MSTTELIARDGTSLSVSQDEKQFELVQRKAKLYASSTLVPKDYQGNVANVVIAMNMAWRLGADILMVMQNLYVVHGNPGWSSKFLIATFNECGKFSSIKYRFSGEVGKDSWGCVAYATELSTGDEVNGTEITIKMAKDEKWYDKAGSKWKTMPEQMLRYRAAAFMIRTVAPELSMGLMTAEELSDMGSKGGQVTSQVEALESLLEKETEPLANPLPDGVSREFAEAVAKMLEQCETPQDYEDAREALKSETNKIEEAAYVDSVCDAVK